jgi:hypothetical protein
LPITTGRQRGGRVYFFFGSGFWGGFIRKGIFAGLIFSLAGLIGRQVLYDIVHENPEAFPTAEAAFTILFFPVVSIPGAGVNHHLTRILLRFWPSLSE